MKILIGECEKIAKRVQWLTQSAHDVTQFENVVGSYLEMPTFFLPVLESIFLDTIILRRG